MVFLYVFEDYFVTFHIVVFNGSFINDNVVTDHKAVSSPRFFLFTKTLSIQIKKYQHVQIAKHLCKRKIFTLKIHYVFKLLSHN